MTANLLLLFTAVLWGIWGWADKNAVTRAHPYTVQWMYSLPYVLFLPLWYAMGSRTVPASNLDTGALFWAVTASLSSIFAMILLLFALRTKPASIAIAVTSAYPMVTLILSVLSGDESFSLAKVIGILLVFAGVLLLQSE
jgi:bacterial/archaeal transporter family protein